MGVAFGVVPPKQQVLKLFSIEIFLFEMFDFFFLEFVCGGALLVAKLTS
jgi:hypothetical protein